MKRFSVFASISIIAVLLASGFWLLFSAAQRATSPAPQAKNSAHRTMEAVSPLLFGTNMSLYDDNDQLMNSARVQAQSRALHIHIIRMPVRATLSEQIEIRAANAIRAVGAIPLVVLRGAVDSSALVDDVRIVNDMNHVFGNGTAYYEYGNEEDLSGVNASAFVASWNAVVPRLKRAARNGRFVGPVTSQYNNAYLTFFLQHANPRPDAVSWHEYTCDDSWSNTLCIARIDHWTNHIQGARQVMNTTIHITLPIMITEWNYAANARDGDGKINNSHFMTTWTMKALQTLAANAVFASMQYSCTNSVYALVNGNNMLSAQAIAMQQFYQQTFG